MDDTAELYENELSVFGGPYSQWRAWLDAEQDAARQAERAAAQAVRREKRDRIEAETKIAHATGDGPQGAVREAGAADRRGRPQARRRRCRRASCAPRCAIARRPRATALDAAERRVRDDDTIRIDLPDPGVPAGRRIATIGDGERSWVIQGPERVALIGPNGVGKTTLLEALVRGVGVPYSGSDPSAGPSRPRNHAPSTSPTANSA